MFTRGFCVLKLTRFDGYAGDDKRTPHEHRNKEHDAAMMGLSTMEDVLHRLAVKKGRRKIALELSRG
jgi:hypothetical protein